MPPIPRPPALERVSLYTIAFLAGAVLMAAEVLAFRVIGKNFGSALRETSAVIAVFLTAMSLGYALGGVLGDRLPRVRTLVAPLLLAGAWTAFVPSVERAIGEAIATSNAPFATHALLTTLALFAVPAALLASVSPIVIRLVTSGAERAGRAAGFVSALSALGSIAGTLVTGFYLIGSFPISSSFRGLGIVSGVLAVAALLLSSRPRAAAVPLTGRQATLLILLLVPLPASARVVFEKDSAYHNIRVVDRGAFRHLFFDDTRQSRMLIDDPSDGGYAYTRLFHLAWLFSDSIDTALFLGLGGATGPREFLLDYPSVRVEVAEVDPAVVDVARTYFALPDDDDRLRVRAVDARVELTRRDAPVTVIVVDAYSSGRYGSMIPFHVTTQEFFELANRHLDPDGVLLYNVVEQIGGYSDRFLRALVRTMQTTFAEVYLFEALESNNTVVAAVPTSRSWDVEAIALRAEALVRTGTVTRPDFVEDAMTFFDGELELGQVPVLTDDYAPVDQLLAR